MPSSGATDDGPHVKWIGSLSVGQVDCVRGHVLVAPQQAVDYRRARILLRHGLDPVHFVETDIVDGTIRVPVPSSLATDPSAPVAVPHTPVSVVLCTRERPADLAGALASIVALDYRNFEVVVVDNAPTSDSTERVVNALGDPRVRRIVEPVPGLSSARNAGLQAARHEIVAFTDDDVVVDRNWLHCIARGFARHPDASCVCGLVPSGELRTAAQAYFDQRVSWSDSLDPRRYSLADPPADAPFARPAGAGGQLRRIVCDDFEAEARASAAAVIEAVLRLEGDAAALLRSLSDATLRNWRGTEVGRLRASNRLREALA